MAGKQKFGWVNFQTSVGAIVDNTHAPFGITIIYGTFL